MCQGRMEATRLPFRKAITTSKSGDAEHPVSESWSRGALLEQDFAVQVALAGEEASSLRRQVPFITLTIANNTGRFLSLFLLLLWSWLLLLLLLLLLLFQV